MIFFIKRLLPHLIHLAMVLPAKRLYQLARQGLEVDRPARQVRVSKLELLSYDPETREGTLQVACSKGTYIRTLIEDAARAAGSCGTMTALRRTAACGFEEGEALSLDRLRELGERGEIPTVLRPVESLFGDYPAAWVSQAQARRFQNGGSLSMERLRLPRIALPQGQLVRVFAPGQVFLGLGAVDLPRGEIVFRKLFWEPEEQV